MKFYIHVNSPAWADENELKCEKGRFYSEMNEINSRWVIFNLYEWKLFKSEIVHSYVIFKYIQAVSSTGLRFFRNNRTLLSKSKSHINTEPELKR